MTRDKVLGQLRVALTAIGTIFIAYGIDGMLTPAGGDTGTTLSLITGFILAGTSLTVGVVKHEGASMVWSLVRKALNAGGALIIYYNIMTPDKWEALIGVIGPILAMRYSWAANGEKSSNQPSLPGFMFAFLLFFAPFVVLVPLLLVGCAGTFTFTPDGALIINPDPVVIHPLPEK